MKIAKSKLAQIIQEELSNTMTEGFGLVGALSAVKDAENKGIVDAQDDFADTRAGRPVKQTDTTEETQEEEIAYAKAYHDTMDRLKQNVADRKLNRPPEPEGEPDVQHYDGEFFQEGANKIKITKTQLATIVKEELGDYPSFSNMESLLSRLLSSIEGLDLSIDYLAGSISGEDAYSAGANQRAFGRYATSSPALKENKMKITKSKLSQIIKEELAATNLQEAPLPADEYKETVEYLWTQFLSHIVLPFKHATNLNGEVPPAITTIMDYWEKKDFKGMASEFLDLEDEVDEWLESRGINWSLDWVERDGKRIQTKDGYLNYSIDGEDKTAYRSLFSSNFSGAFRLIRMLIDKPPAEGYSYRGFAGMSKPGVTSARYKQDDNLGRRQTQEGKNKMKITKTHLSRIIQEEVAAIKAEGYGAYKRDNDWGDLEEEEIYALEALMSLGGEQPAGDIAAVASEKYENANRSIDYSDPRNPDTGLGEEDFGDYIQTALDSLQAKGKVRLTQGEPGSGVEAFYALA